MKLIYRALIFDYTPRSVQTYQKPRALNWRFQPPIVSNTSQASRSLT